MFKITTQKKIIKQQTEQDKPHFGQGYRVLWMVSNSPSTSRKITINDIGSNDDIVMGLWADFRRPWEKKEGLEIEYNVA